MRPPGAYSRLARFARFARSGEQGQKGSLSSAVSCGAAMASICLLGEGNDGYAYAANQDRPRYGRQAVRRGG